MSNGSDSDFQGLTITKAWSKNYHAAQYELDACPCLQGSTPWAWEASHRSDWLLSVHPSCTAPWSDFPLAGFLGRAWLGWIFLQRWNIVRFQQHQWRQVYKCPTRALVYWGVLCQRCFSISAESRTRSFNILLNSCMMIQVWQGMARPFLLWALLGAELLLYVSHILAIMLRCSASTCLLIIFFWRCVDQQSNYKFVVGSQHWLA